MMRLLRRLFLLSVAGIGAVVTLVGFNLHGYERLTDEAPVARLRFVAVAPQRYQVELRSGDFCQAHAFVLYGDEWRIDAQFLKWKPWANILGLDARYRLDRLSGRYRDVEQENNEPHVAWALSETSLFDPAQLDGGWLARFSPVDTVYGSSVYQAIEPGYEYTVYRGQSGLLVRKSQPATIRRDGDSLVIPIDNPCIAGRSGAGPG